MRRRSVSGVTLCPKRRRGKRWTKGSERSKGELAESAAARGALGSHQQFVLKHAAVGEVVYSLMLLAQRQRLHKQVAEWYLRLFALTKDDDVRKYVIRREIPAKSDDKKPSSKAPKIQRLVTPISLQRKRHRMAQKKARQAKCKTEAAEYQKLCAQRQKESREKRQEKLSQRKSQRSSRAED